MDTNQYLKIFGCWISVADHTKLIMNFTEKILETKMYAFCGIWTNEYEYTRTWVEPLRPLGQTVGAVNRARPSQQAAWKRRASIPLPRACEARALPFELHSQKPTTELHARFFFFVATSSLVVVQVGKKNSNSTTKTLKLDVEKSNSPKNSTFLDPRIKQLVPLDAGGRYASFENSRYATSSFYEELWNSMVLFQPIKIIFWSNY